MTRILILGGTEDGLALHRLLAAEKGFAPQLSLAGRTATPRTLPPGTRIGGFGGADGLAAYLDAGRIDLLVDATHPFAVRISQNAAEAATRTGTPRLVLTRPPWQPEPGDTWRNVTGEAEAAAALPGGAAVFLALGAQRLGAFTERADIDFVLRVIDPPATPLLPFSHKMIVGRGPFHAEAEIRLFTDHGISHVVARNSGGRGAAAKLKAARRLGLPVIMIVPPAPPPGPAVATVEEARDWVMDRFA